MAHSGKGIESLIRKAIEDALNAMIDDMNGKASAILDPETGRHPVVIVRKISNSSVVIKTNGSAAYARKLEKKLGLNSGDIELADLGPAKARLVYLAHASEDKETAQWLAEGLLRRGIDVWFDTWEIHTGDSLRRKMEQGLGDCTHFVVLLSQTAMKKPWVQEEVDAGLAAQVEGLATFVGLRMNLAINELTPFLKTRRCPVLDHTDAGLDALAGDILGVSLKPPLGSLPSYATTSQIEKTGWSRSAVSVAGYFVRETKNATKYDPQVTFDQLAKNVGLPMPDLRLGVLDLCDAGLLERGREIGRESVHALAPLFAEFDDLFMEWKPAEDGAEVAKLLHNMDATRVATVELGKVLGWPPRRLNPALTYLVEARAVHGTDVLSGSHYRPSYVSGGDSLLRFVRNLG
ncbi:toll/interleukin-1 receptor domain-containing protein (plasmid) [Rhizobium leguminosarum]